jgi:DNA-binding transcriptional ArsR family regulator
MTTTPNEVQSSPDLDNDEIFKSLSHKIRRNIINIIGTQKEISFGDIKNKIGNIDSPTLAYHLKSLKPLLNQKENLYVLSDIGKTAHLLINKIDQSDQLKANKKKWWKANMITIICWIIVQQAIPFIIARYVDIPVVVMVVIILHVTAQVNYFVIWRLWKKGSQYQ